MLGTTAPPLYKLKTPSYAAPLTPCTGCRFTYNGAYADGTSTQGGYSTHYVLPEK